MFLYQYRVQSADYSKARFYSNEIYRLVFKRVSALRIQLPELRLRHQRRLAVAMTAMVVVSTLTWLPLGVVPLALMMSCKTGDDDDEGMKGQLLLLVAVIAQSSVVSAPLMHVAGGRNLRRSAVSFFSCQRQKVGRKLPRCLQLDLVVHQYFTDKHGLYCF